MEDKSLCSVGYSGSEVKLQSTLERQLLVRKQRVMHTGVQQVLHRCSTGARQVLSRFSAVFFFFIQSRTPAWGVTPLIVTVPPPISVELNVETSSRTCPETCFLGDSRFCQVENP